MHPESGRSGFAGIFTPSWQCEQARYGSARSPQALMKITAAQQHVLLTALGIEVTLG